MLAENNSGKATETVLLQRVRDSIRGRDIIDWANDDFESFLALFDVIHLQDGNFSQMKDGSIYVNTLPDMVRMHAQCKTSHVLITSLNENCGAFATYVPYRTAQWGEWHSQILDAGCTPQMVQQYLNDPKVKAVITTQHTALWHASILSLPIGVRESHAIIDRIAHTDGIKTQDLLLNNSGWEHRQQINECVIENFGGRIRNTYGAPQAEYFESIVRSRFVLCPSGLGWDSYRIWETLLLGSIPIVEFSAGWHTVLDDLPVLFVTNFNEVTPELLARAYPEIMSQCARFDYGKLTKQWWVAKINKLLNAP